MEWNTLHSQGTINEWTLLITHCVEMEILFLKTDFNKPTLSLLNVVLHCNLCLQQRFRNE